MTVLEAAELLIRGADMGNRRTARENILKILFQWEHTGQAPSEIFASFWETNPDNTEVVEFTEKVCLGTLRNLREIDELIEKHSTNWKLARMSYVDRNLLRSSTFELMYLTDIPSSVTINEAVEIAKKYGTEESSGFINGILDKISHLKGA